MKIIAQRDMSAEPVSHAPSLNKYVMIRNGDVPHLTNLSTAILPPLAVVLAHSHIDMYEIFYVQQGLVVFCIDGQEFMLDAGATIVIEPGESHELKNTGSSDVHLLYFGVIA